MNKCIKTLIIKTTLILFLIPHLASAEEPLIPLAEYTANKADWQSNLYEVFYVASRCALLYGAAYNEQGDVDNDTVSKDLYDQAITILGGTEDLIERKLGSMSDYPYAYELENKMMNVAHFYYKEAGNSYLGDNQFKGMIGDDLNTCEGYDDFFEGLLRDMV